MDVFLAQPRGFCAGVTRAIEIVERALELHGAPVYVYHEIVHNQWVVNSLRGRGAVFVDQLKDVPVGSVVVFSAHGVAESVVQEARTRQLHPIDATCPLVSKVHLQLRRYAARGIPLVMIGHAGHEEVVGTTGQVQVPVHLVSEVEDVARLPLPPGGPLAYVTQTTLSLDDTRSIVEALGQRHDAVGPHTDDICYATQNRQTAVRAMAAQVDVVLVVGARNSSNSRRLQEVAERAGVTSLLVQDASEITDSQRTEWRSQGLRIGITAGASTPELLVRQVVQRLQDPDDRPATQLAGVREDVNFRLPQGLGVPVSGHGR
ncbi:MAG: 4-hydroxy-3-methylbut-2-enyl diphosphate reductase [Burkholderiales bacterium]|nr:MAG: 4-hydroxy-3-methylbut-2-enyl diphosphate reductase [Burkholderiales bacterium]